MCAQSISVDGSMAINRVHKMAWQTTADVTMRSPSALFVSFLQSHGTWDASSWNDAE